MRAIKRLSALKVKALKKPGRYADGDGLYLYVSKVGNRSWVFRYRDRITGKLRDKGLGPERDVTLDQAREEARKARQQLRTGVDPIGARHALRAELQADRARLVTFGYCADLYIAAHKAGWRNAKHADQWRNTLSTYGATLLPLPVSVIDTGTVLVALEPVWAVRTETATRVRQRIEAVLDWATARGYRGGENPARWRGHLDKLLPKPAKLKGVTPRAALPYDEMAKFFVELKQQSGLSPQALKLQILTATRPGEVAGAKWVEFDLDTATWTIPGERMKAGKPHRIPLAPVAVKLLQTLSKQGQYVFPGVRGRPMTTAAPLKVLKALRPGVTAHGFRSTFRDWAADMTAYPREIAEQALAHALKDKSEAAYRRSDLFTKRANLMADWAEYCETPRNAGSKVSLIGKARRGDGAG